MTVAERKVNELASLLSDHRVVRVEMQAEHAFCVARVDMPEYGIHQGETFQLFASSYVGYAYIVNANGCGCLSYEHKYGTCKHSQAASKCIADRYFAAKWDESDTEAHVVDSIAPDAMDVWDDPKFAAMSKSEQDAAYRNMYSGDFYDAA